VIKIGNNKDTSQPVSKMHINDDSTSQNSPEPIKSFTRTPLANSKVDVMNSTRHSKFNNTQQSITALWKGISSLSASVGDKTAEG
jgi:hypothetical protein